MIDVSMQDQSRWGKGACIQGTVTNVGTTSADWEVTLDLEGPLTNSWNCQITQVGNRATFVGTQWNHTVAPGAMADFGYCVSF
jgi:endoglucanase